MKREDIERIAKKWKVIFSREITLHDELLKKIGTHLSLVKIAKAQL